MNEESKKSLQLALEILRKTCIEQGISIAVDKKTGALNFFDTDIYMSTNRFKGIKVDISSLVN